MRIDNQTIYLLESSPGVEFADFRNNKIYIKVNIVKNPITKILLYFCNILFIRFIFRIFCLLGLCDVAQSPVQHSITSTDTGHSQ